MLNLNFDEDRVGHGGFRGGCFYDFSVEMTTVTTIYKGGGGRFVRGTLE